MVMGTCPAPVPPETSTALSGSCWAPGRLYFWFILTPAAPSLSAWEPAQLFPGGRPGPAAVL